LGSQDHREIVARKVSASCALVYSEGDGRKSACCGDENRPPVGDGRVQH
ncbi:unnamed protein product, partial [Ectocarpus sp. 12 AP-2014]